MSNTPNLRHERKQLIAISSLRNRGRRGTEVNECETPDRGASKADLIEFHQEELRGRRRRLLARQSNSSFPRSTSIAADRHEHKREIARRSHQSAFPPPS